MPKETTALIKSCKTGKRMPFALVAMAIVAALAVAAEIAPRHRGKGSDDLEDFVGNGQPFVFPTEVAHKFFRN